MPPEEQAPNLETTVTPTLEFPSQPSKPTGGHLVCGGNIDRRELENILKKFNRRALSDYRERGVRILYAAFGMLTWREIATNEEISSPLIMVPVELTRKSVLEPFTLSVPIVEEIAIPNPALQVKLHNDFKIDLPSFPENGEAQSLTDYFESVRRLFERFGWRVEPTVEIGLFSFHKLVIYRDLEANANAIVTNPIIRAITGSKGVKLVMDSLPEEKDVDAIETPDRIFRVLDADSSQRISIDYALQGQSFVMQGPPGTGKSQTIANIISECIARGKSVLFVSDKMAALEVVYKRLKEVGLAPFCLELHSSKANKQEVVAELMRCLNEQLVPRNLPSAHDFDKLQALQNSLNSYVQSLHGNHPKLQMSPFEVLCELTKLEAMPSVPVGITNVGEMTPQRMQELENLVAQLSSVWQPVEEKDFPWRGFRGSSYTLDVRSELTTFLQTLISQLNLLSLEATEFSEKLGLETPRTFAQINWLIELSHLLYESPKPEPNWLTHSNIYEVVHEAQIHQEMFEWRQTKRAELLTSYKESIFNLNVNKSAEIEQAVKSVQPFIVSSSAEDGDLFKKQEQLAKFLASNHEFTEKWVDHANGLVQQLGLPTGNISFERVMQLSRLAQLCFSENKPETAWFDPETFRSLEEIVPKAKKDFQENNLLRSQITKAYDDRIYSLDLDEFTRRYNGPYRGFSRYLKPAFYRDQKQIVLLTREGQVPKTVAKDLIDARKAKVLQAEIDGYKAALENLLGHYYDGQNTDFQKVEKAMEARAEIFEILGFTPVPENLSKLASYGTTPPQQIRWLGVELQQSTASWKESVEGLSTVIPTSMLPNSKLSIYETPLTELQKWTDPLEKQITQLLELTSDVLQTCKNEPANYRQIIEGLKVAEAVRKREVEFLSNRTALKVKFGVRFQEFNTNWKEILSALDWTKKAQTMFGSPNMPDAFVNALAAGTENAPSNMTMIQRFKEATASLSTLESRFEDELTYRGTKVPQATLDAAIEKATVLKDRVDDLRVWIDFKDIKDRFSLAGLAPLFNHLSEKPFAAEQLVDIFLKGAYQEWINNLYIEDERLGHFRRENHEQTISDFKKVDIDLIQRSASRVIEAANTRKPHDILIQAEDSEIGVLLKESAKKRRLMPIRSLLQRMPNLLPRLKPCLLMSPISVSQFLAPDMKFDLILYDEASQIVPEDAVGSIYRGKGIVVAGDNKQLPPTSFFQKSLIEDVDWDEMNESDVEVFDSILDECLGIGLPVKTLRWHYRSRHETLITFSNDRFYNSALVTFPAAHAENEALGVKLFPVSDGIYDRGGRRNNPVEAEAVASLVFEHFKRYPEKTLGVVTFSIAQMETIEEAVERRIVEQPEYEHFFREDRLEGFFIKNLENVQGDERDVMIFSIGYGRDQQGQMTMNFGPLNKAGGERRLNVAVTRAREKVVVVTSIKASDIAITTASPAGLQALRGYLEYAEKTRAASHSPTQFVASDSALDEAVGKEIQEMDYNIIPRVGCSGYPIDIGVVDPINPGSYLLGIECDGATYRASNAARDRDRLREQVLKQLGWRIHHIWSPDWVARRDSEVRRLKTAIDEASRSRTETVISQPIQHEPQFDIEVKQVQFGSSERIGIPYRVHRLKANFSPYLRIPLSKYPYSAVEKNEFYFQENRVLQSRLLEELVREEGPIHFDLAVRRLAAAWAVQRVGPKVVQAVHEALDMLIKDHRLTVRDNFLWPNDLVEIPVRVPIPGEPESLRLLEHIPPEEIEKALKLVAKYALGIKSESLIIETARVFGITRLNEGSRTRIRTVYDRLLREGRLRENNGIVTVS